LPGTSNKFSTISLIGMPGSGKSTVGVILAKLTGLRFRDTDLDIQVREHATLQDILEQRGYRYLRSLEEQVILAVDLEDAVIATGGSAVYSEACMRRLHRAGPLVYLEADLGTLERRVAAAPMRGIASEPHRSFADVYAERTPLYRRHAALTVDATTGSADEIAEHILSRLGARQ
jgi:shikimate kinase